ncbi:MAG TPA: ABC transporter permease [Blastocatellia bacterium]|nr:ABC transporter permease [Blastocatellia bacterium]
MPDWKAEVRKRLLGLQLAPTREAAIVEELAQRHDESYAELLASGMSEADAYRHAHAELYDGGLLTHGLRRIERSTNSEPIILGTNRRTNMIATLWQDLRFGVRMLLKHPDFTLIAALTLAVGIGANTSIFSIVNAVLLRPFPYQAPERLVIVQEGESGGGFSPSYPNFVDWRAQNTAFASIAAVRQNESFNLTGAGEPERLQGQLVSAEFFSMLGIKPLVGRDFLPEEDRAGATPAVILSYGFWQRRFGNDPGIIGQQLTLNDQSYTIVGITPPDFRYGLEVDVTVPFGLQTQRFSRRGADPGTGVVARLKPHVSQQQGESDLNMVAARLEQQYPATNKGRRVLLTPLHESFVGDVRRPLLILLGAVGLVLLIACANVANLLLVRASARQKEMAVRVALGASRATLVRQLLTESVLLAASGAALGILLAFWGTSFIAAQLPTGIPRLQEANVDARVLVFTLAVSLLTGLLFGLAPALQASRPNLTEGLKEGERGSSGRRQRLRSVLVVGEVALTLTLLVGAGLLIQSFRRALEVNPGFKPQNLLTMQVSVNKPNGEQNGQQVANFFEQLQQNVRNLPGVKSVAVSNGIPFGSTNFPPFLIEGRPVTDGKPSGLRYHVSPTYFQTMGIELLKGRLFTAGDTPNTPMVVIIDEVLAQRYFPNEEPLGQRLKPSADAPSWEIVGVVRHAEPNSLDAQGPAPAQFYLNFDQIPVERLPGYVRRLNLLTRTEVEPLSLTAAVRAQVAALNKDQAVFNVRTMEQAVAQSVAPRRFSMLLLSVFAVVALALASLGIYGLMSYVVAQSTREIGVRMALGAEVSDVLKLALGQGMKQALVGVALGLVASLALTRMMKTLLFGVSATDPLTFAAIALLLTGIALLACWLPARRATKVDPIIALRAE